MQIISGPRICAGVAFDPKTNTCVAAAPIVKYMLGWTKQKAFYYARKRNWTINIHVGE